MEDTYRKKVTVDGETHLLRIFDNAADYDDCYIAMRDQYYRTSQVTSRPSFDEVTSFRQQILHVRDVDHFPMILVGNKRDLGSERQVTTTEGQELANSWGIPFMETSAKSYEEISDLFTCVVRLVRERTEAYQVKALNQQLTSLPLWKIFQRKSLMKQIRELICKRELRPLLSQRTSKYLHLSFLTEGTEEEISRLSSFPPRPTVTVEESSISECFLSLLRSEAYSDFDLPVSEGVVLKAHKVILSTRSEFFSHYFSSSSSSLPSASVETWQSMLVEIYSGIPSPETSELGELRKALCLHSYESSLKHLLKDSSMADIEVEVKEEEQVEVFHLHKCILHCRFPFFQGLMDSQWKEQTEGQGNRVVISDMRIKSFKVLVEYLYLDRFEELDNETAGELLVIANRENLSRAKNFCEKTLERVIQKEYLVETLLDSILHRSFLLQKVCEWEAARPESFETCQNDPNWNKLDEDIRKRICADHAHRVQNLKEKEILTEKVNTLSAEMESIKRKTATDPIPSLLESFTITSSHLYISKYNF